jgi:hypothetical protein
VIWIQSLPKPFAGRCPHRPNENRQGELGTPLTSSLAPYTGRMCVKRCCAQGIQARYDVLYVLAHSCLRFIRDYTAGVLAVVVPFQFPNRCVCYSTTGLITAVPNFPKKKKCCSHKTKLHKRLRRCLGLGMQQAGNSIYLTVLACSARVLSPYRLTLI